jgi:hypothetical protein
MRAVHHPRPTNLPWGGSEVPHATIEMNQVCNLACEGCYKHKFSFQKPVEELKKEIDFVATKRNLETLTLLGGEPTLHPSICDIVRYVKSKGIRPHILTNATTLNESLLVALKSAGVARITMHIDSHQGKRPDFPNAKPTEAELDDLRRGYVALCKKVGIDTGLAVTIYRDTIADFANLTRLAEEIGSTKVLATTYCQEANIEERPADSLSIYNLDVFNFFAARKIYPAWSIGSDNSATDLRWMIYNSAVTRSPSSGQLSRLQFDPRHRLAMWLLPRLARMSLGHHRFESAPVLRERFVGLLLMALLALVSTAPWGALKILSFLLGALKNENLEFHSVIIQELPRQQPDGAYNNCADCPDATVRNGKIIPVCYVDKVEPWAGTASS